MYISENRYYKNSKISEYRFRRILRGFSLDFTATDTAKITGVSLRSVNSIFIKMRCRISEYCEAKSPYSSGVEPDESYIASNQVNGKTRRNARENAIVFGIFQRNDSIYTEIVHETIKRPLIEVVKGRIDLEAGLHLEGWKSYDGLVDLGCKRYFRMRSLWDKLETEPSPINRIESFWAYAKFRLAKFKGLGKQTFYFHLKETEFRFNHRHDNLYKLLMTILRNNPI